MQGAKTLNDDELAAYIKKNKFKTIHGEIEFGANGEWKKSGMLQVQYHSIKPGAPTVETWRGMDYQTVLTPGELQDRQRWSIRTRRRSSGSNGCCGASSSLLR